MKIAFQTLACPEWSWEQVLSEAQRMGYDGIELRGVEGEMYLPKARPFLPEHIEQSRAQLREKGLEICCLDTSCAFHAEERYSQAIQEGKDTIDLAVQLGVPYIRVFGDKIPDESQKEAILRRVAEGLTTLGNYAEGKGVTVLLETHGDFNQHELLSAVFEQTNSAAVGLLWDFEHPYMHGEAPEDTYIHLAPYIKHTHVKDAKRVGDQKQLCLIGEGEVPVRDIVKLLRDGGYTGWLSLEFEKKWKPELEEPEVSLPAYMSFIQAALKS